MGKPVPNHFGDKSGKGWAVHGPATAGVSLLSFGVLDMGRDPTEPDICKEPGREWGVVCPGPLRGRKWGRNILFSLFSCWGSLLAKPSWEPVAYCPQVSPLGLILGLRRVEIGFGGAYEKSPGQGAFSLLEKWKRNANPWDQVEMGALARRHIPGGPLNGLAHGKVQNPPSKPQWDNWQDLCELAVLQGGSDVGGAFPGAGHVLRSTELCRGAIDCISSYYEKSFADK